MICTILIIFSGILADYCSYETCRTCCQVTPTGCINAIDFNIRVYLTLIKGRYVSYKSYCQDCVCDDPTNGCGWKASNFGRVECTSCEGLKSMNSVEVVIINNKTILECFRRMRFLRF